MGGAGSGGGAGERQGGDELQAAHAGPRNTSTRRDGPAAEREKTLRTRRLTDKLLPPDGQANRAVCPALSPHRNNLRQENLPAQTAFCIGTTLWSVRSALSKKRRTLRAACRSEEHTSEL